MKFLSFILLSAWFFSCNQSDTSTLFDGTTFNGWEGDTTQTWKIVDGVIVGGSLDETVPHNDFLCTVNSYDNFVLKLKYRIEGEEGFINGGVQFRSERMTDPAYEMIGYQADIGSKFDGALYDESRRRTFLAGLDTLKSGKIAQHGAWNHMEIIAEDNRVQILLNDQLTVDYIEPDPGIIQKGKIALQVHGDGKSLVSFKDIIIKEL